MDKNTVFKVKRYLEDRKIVNLDKEKSKMQLRAKLTHQLQKKKE